MRDTRLDATPCSGDERTRWRALAARFAREGIALEYTEHLVTVRCNRRVRAAVRAHARAQVDAAVDKLRRGAYIEAAHIPQASVNTRHVGRRRS